MYFCSNKDGIKIDDKYVLMHAFVVVVVVIRTKPKLFKNIYYFRKKIHMRLLHATIAPNGTKELHFDSFSRKESLTMPSLS